LSIDISRQQVIFPVGKEYIALAGGILLCRWYFTSASDISRGQAL